MLSRCHDGVSSSQVHMLMGNNSFCDAIVVLDNPGHIMTRMANGIAYLFRCVKQNL